MKVHLKLISVLLSAVISASIITTHTALSADEISGPEETQTTDVTVKENNKETEDLASKKTKETEETEKMPETSENQESSETESQDSKVITQETEMTESQKIESAEDNEPVETKKRETNTTDTRETSKAKEKVSDAKPIITDRRKSVNEVSIKKTQDNTCLGTSKIASPIPPAAKKTWTGSYVYFGKISGTPIKFRVLAPKTTSYGGSTLFLESDELLVDMVFDDKTNVWANSAVKKYLNGDFLKNFTPSEQAAIAKSTRSAHKLVVGQTAGTVASWTKETFENYVALRGEKVFILDVEEVSNIDYGYKPAYGSVVCREKTGVDVVWWLRSAAVTPNYGCIVGASGFLAISSVPTDKYGVHAPHGISPALNINQSSIIFSSIISGSFNTVGAEYKLTIKDPNLMIAVPAGRHTEESGATVTIPYKISGKNAGNATRVSYLITNKAGTEIKYYNALSGGTSGIGTFELPSTLSLSGWGTDYDVYILAEQINGSQTTDYASALVKVASPYDNTLTVAPKTAKVKYKKLRKKKQTVSRSKVMNVQYPVGKVTYKLTGVKRGKSKKYYKYFKINTVNGNVTIKKKLKKGTYKVTCSVTAEGDSYYKSSTKTITFKIKVK